MKRLKLTVILQCLQETMALCIAGPGASYSMLASLPHFLQWAWRWPVTLAPNSNALDSSDGFTTKIITPATFKRRFVRQQPYGVSKTEGAASARVKFTVLTSPI